jgi:hypothetical protein
MNALVALSTALDALLVTGPDALTPIERSALFSQVERGPLPPRVAAALDRLVTLGAVVDLLDLAAWSRSTLAARGAVAHRDGAIEPLASALTDAPLEAQPVERWIERCEAGGPEAELAAALLATAPGDRVRDAFVRVVQERGWAGARWIEPVLRCAGEGSDFSSDLIVWADEAPASLRAAALLACARRAVMDDALRARWLVVAEQLHAELDLAACLRALVDRDVGLAVDALFTWLAVGAFVARSEHEAVLRAMSARYDARWPPWARARVASGEASAWEVEALDRWLRRNGAR